MSLRSLRLLRTAVLAVLALSLAGFGGQSLTRVWRLMQEVDSLEREVAVLSIDPSSPFTHGALLGRRYPRGLQDDVGSE